MKKILLIIFCVTMSNSMIIAKDKIKQKNEKKSETEEEQIKPDWIDVPEHKYGGYKYRSPFVPRGGKSVKRSGVDSNKASEKIENPGEMIVTGLFSAADGQYAILSGSNEFFIIKQGRLYNEDSIEIPGIAAIIKKDKIILITNENKMFELPLPQ